MKSQEWKLVLFLAVIALAAVFASSSFYLAGVNGGEREDPGQQVRG